MKKVASAASIHVDSKKIEITGTSTITNITGPKDGDIVTVYPTGACVFDTGGNVAFSKTATAGTPLVLMCREGQIYLVGGSSGGAAAWADVTGKPATYPPEAHTHDYAATGHDHAGVYATAAHNHDAAYAALGHNHTGTYEPANANIQTHVASAHAPSNAQKNSDITKAEIEAKLTGEISSHTHAGGGGGPTKISGNSGAFAADTTWQTLTANSADVTVTTQTVAITMTGLGAGTYRVKGALVFQTAATTTGIGVTLNHTGTVTRFVSNMIQVTTGGAAATGVGDQSTATLAGQLVEGKAERAKDTRSSFWAGVDSANADELLIVDSVFIVTVSGDLQVKIATEVAGSAVRLMAGSTIEVSKVV